MSRLFTIKDTECKIGRVFTDMLQRWEPKSQSARKEGQLETVLQAVEDKDKDPHDEEGWKLDLCQHKLELENRFSAL